LKTVNYDKVADGYDKRYKEAYKQNGIASKLLDLIHTVKARRVLEVGCGTGHWLGLLQEYIHAIGIDLSHGMLQKAAMSNVACLLVRGEANCLPFAAQTFDVVFCVNAIHHFRSQSEFVVEAHRLLKPDGVLAVIGMNPHTGKDRWFIYDYFQGTYDADLCRYPSTRTISDWMKSVGFEQITEQVAERLHYDKCTKNVLPLSKDFTSQLSLLTDVEYAKGIGRIKAAISKAKEAEEDIFFPVDISLTMVKGHAIK